MMVNPALIICDMLNKFDFPKAERILPHAKKASKKIASLKKHFHEQNLPVIYVNDNFDEWLSDWKTLWALCRKPGCPGRDIARELKPHPRDYFILKPKHSAFHDTAFDLLLKKLRVETLVLTGVAGDICVLFTAHDAHMREYKVVVPSDCVASNTKRGNDFALRQLREHFGMNTSASPWIKKTK